MKNKILIIDDSQLNREFLEDILCDEYHILLAENGIRGISLIRQHLADLSLVLLDLVMPEMDGFEVLEYMNRNGWIHDIPVMMISSETNGDSVTKAYELGASDFINRPFNINIVRKRVSNIISLFSKQRKLKDILTEQIYEKEKRSSLMIAILSHIVEFRNGESGLHIFKLQHANVHSVYPLANHVISQRTWGKRSLSAARPTLTLDVANNAIVVYGTPKDIEQVGELIQKLDESNIDQVREMKTYRIASRNVHILINQIQVFYNDQMRSHPELGVADAIFLPDPEFNCINVAATKDQLTLIDEIINKLEEREALPDRQLKLIPVANGRNYEIINALSYLLNFRRNQRTAEPGPWITPETRTGGIYIYGTAAGPSAANRN